MKEFYRNNGIYAYSCEIPQTYTTTETVYFVSGDNGDEYGQFDNQAAAADRATFMAKVPTDQRRQYDQ